MSYVASFFLHRGECDFRFFLKLWIVISLKLSTSTVRTATEVTSKFRMWEILVTQKIRSEKFRFLQFSRKIYGIFAFRLRNFTEVEGLYGMTEKNWGISLKLFCQRAPIFFYRGLFKTGFRHPGTYPKKSGGFFWVNPPKKPTYKTHQKPTSKEVRFSFLFCQ